MRRAALRLCLLLLPGCLLHAQPVALSVNTASREEVRQFYRTIFHASENVPMGWTGSYATGNAGDTSAAYKEATRLRINFFRALVGVPADVTFNPTFNARSQQAAMLMSVNHDLSHTPPSSWTGYNAIAAEGAFNSNLALGSAGPDAISGYIADAGDNNAVVGHRRWLFYPQTLQMGSGDVAGIPGNQTRRPANAIWVIDTTPGGQFGAPRPATRTTAVAYPPAGFVPYPLVWPRWSFSYPGADFSSSTVTMTRNGQSVAATREPGGPEAGEPTLVWVYDNLDSREVTSHARPASDITYTVNVNNVRIGVASQNFTYNVTVFDPDVAVDAAPNRVSGTPLPDVGAPNRYIVTKPAFADAFEWRSLALTPATQVFTAESGLENLVATTSPGYDVVQGATVDQGARAYRLTHLTPRADEILRIPGTYLISGGDSVLTFRSRLGIATATEVARVQVSSDDGMSWVDVFTQPGRSATDTSMPSPTEAAFVTRTIRLEEYAGRSIAIRFVFTVGLGITFVPEAANMVGWFIDDVTLTGVQSVTSGAAMRVANSDAFTFTPTTPGPVGLQARGILFTAYPMEWGPIAQVNAVTGTNSSATSYLSNLSVRTSAGAGTQTLIVGFAISGGAKPLLVRGVGPGLAAFQVTNVLSDPKLELYHETTKVAENDNWVSADAATFSRVGAFGLANDSRDSALVISLAPGSYTAQLGGTSGGPGHALLELYDAAAAVSGAKLANVSARSQIGGDNETLIAGFAIAGQGSRTLLIRAVGPGLSALGIEGALADAKLELFGTNGKIQENDNWDISARATFPEVGAFDLTTNSGDAVLVVTLPPGSYTAQLSSVNGATGVALVEVYALP